MIYQVLITFCVLLNVVLADGGIIGHHHQPYAFGYSVKDHHGEQRRQESGDGGHVVKGSYGFSDDRGVHREVDYVADHGGFRAVVKTNEPGTANQDPAAVKIHSSTHVNVNGDGGHGYGAGYGELGHAGNGYGDGDNDRYGY